jgi:uncharacterized membrane protein (DUF485 family)
VGKPGWYDPAQDLDLDDLDGYDLGEEAALLEDDGVLEDVERFQIDTALQEIAEQTSYGEVFLQDLIRRQISLSLGIALIFLSVLLGLPLLYAVVPELGLVQVLGLPLHWIVLAVVMYPFLWLLAAYYIREAGEREDEFTRLLR